MNNQNKTVFISGHGNLTFEEWLEHYKPLIDKCLLLNYHFILGDFRGTDVLSIEYLKNKTSNVTICHCFKKARYNVDIINLQSANWKYVGGFKTDEERDSYMTSNSDEDIAWIRYDKINSCTAKNIERRNNI